MKYVLVVYFLMAAGGTERVEFVKDLTLYECKDLMHQTHFTLSVPQPYIGFGLNCELQE